MKQNEIIEVMEKLEEQIKQTDAAMKMLEGQLAEPTSIAKKVGLKLTAFLPVSQKTKRAVEKDMTQMNYAILALNKQLIILMKTFYAQGLKKETCKCSNGMYE